MGCWQPLLCECVPARPCPPVALTASAQRLTPIPHDGIAEYREQTAIARHSRVSIVPQQHAFQPGALRRNGPGQAPPPRVFDCLPFLAKPLSNRLAPDRTVPLPRCTACMRATEKVAGRRCALTPPLTPFSRRAPTLDQPRFLRGQCHIALLKAFLKFSPEPFGVVPVCKAHDAIVTVPPDADIPSCVLSPPSVGPHVQDVVQGAMRRQGAHAAPLGGPFLLRVPLSLCQHARVPPLLPMAHDALVPNPLRDALHQPGVVDRLKAPTEVRIEHPVDVALLDAHRHRIQGLRGAAARSQSRGASTALPLLDGVQHCHRGPLDDRIFPGREADGPRATIRLWDVYARDRTRVVRPSLEAVRPVLQIGLQVLPLGRPGLSVNARSRLAVQAIGRLAASVDVIDMVPQRRQRLCGVPPRCLS
jgi:hypothetical protein